MFRTVISLLLATVVQVAVAQPAPSAKSALVIDTETNTVLFEKNQDAVRPIASITKMMNAMVVLDADLPLDEQITITNDDVIATSLRRHPTGTSLPVGTTLSRGELLHLALMNSQNRAAAALARTYPGGMTAFIEQMNAKAVSLGMTHSSFSDPTGLINTNVSTAEDLAKMVVAASEYPEIREFSTSTSFQLVHYVKEKAITTGYNTTNRLAKLGSWDLIVQKTGFINDAGHCMVAMTTAATHKIVMILLNTPSNDARARDAIALKYWVEHGETMPEPAPAPKRHHHHR